MSSISSPSISRTFSYTGSDQTYIVPPNTTSVVVKMWGAGGGGNGTGKGGGGAYVEGTLAVTPGETLTVIVGAGGSRYDTASNYGGGGGSATVRGQGAQGGGRSAIRRGGTEVVTAGGGGGGCGDGTALAGGAATVDSQSFAGDVTSGTQVQSTAVQSSGSGGGGSTTAGGVNGPWPTARGSAVQFQGGTGGGDAGSGGGGGGYWGGGGGGYSGGGGGGSSYLANLTNTTNSQSASREVAGNTSSPLRGTSGTGGNNVAGGNGLVIIDTLGFQTSQQLRFNTILPTSIAGCVLWLDAADVSTFVLSGSKVTQWNDKSSSGYNVAQTNSVRQPSLTGTPQGVALTGNVALTQTAGNVPLIRDARALTILTVARVTTSVNNNNIITFWFRSIDTVTGATTAKFYLQMSAANNLSIAWNGAATLTSSNSSTQGVSAIIGGIFSTPASTNINGTYTFGTGAVLNVASSDALFTLGYPNYNEVTVYEVLIYNRVLLAPELQQIQAYLARKWGIVSSLPAAQPYRSILPPPSMIYNVPTETLLQTFTATGAIQSYTIPAGTFRVKIYAWGSGGGNGGGGAQGGGGAFVTGTLRVTPGQILYLVVGQRNNTGAPTLALGAGGGLAGKYYEGGGGGLSGVFLGSSPNKSNCVCIAGGGGSANNSTVVAVPLAGGPGGYPNGFPGNSATGRLGGGGGTQASGGAGASGGSVSALYNGTDLFGGNGSTTATDGGYIGGVGSGGGGWFGGGASTQDGTNAGGGGGSSFIGGLQPPIQTENGGYAPSQTGTASAGGESNRYWSSPLGRSAQNGYIVITRFQ